MRTLKERLSKEIKNTYLITGDDFYLFEKAKSMIINACGVQMTDFNICYFDDDNFSAKAFTDSCEVFPIGDMYRVIVLKGITKLSEGDKKEILRYLSNPVSSTVVIIQDFFGKFDFVKKEAELVDAKRMDKSLLVKIIVNDLLKQGKKISAEAVDTLIDACNGYLTKIQNEMMKIVYYSTDELITKAVVDAVVIKDAEYTVFELTDALGKKDGDKAMKLLSLMEKEQGVLSLISNHFRRMFFIGISDMTNSELASYLGVKEYAIVKARGQIKEFSKNQLRKINQLIEEIDYSIKSGAMQATNALYYLVFNILYI